MAATVPGIEIIVVFAIIAAAVALFVTEAIAPDTTAIAVIVTLVVLEPWTRVPAADAISGFANPATVTILAMYILSGGIERTGVITRLGRSVSRYAAGDPRRLLATTLGISGPLAGVINNTPVVAILIPMVTDLADRNHVSPSKLLIPLSYAAMLGGMLTLIGTATNILASDLSADLLDHPFGMFEFTPLGVLVLVTGLAYLLTVGQRLLPERIVAIDLTEKFRMGDYLWRIYVGHRSPLVGRTMADIFAEEPLDIDVLQIVRDGDAYVAPGSDQEIRARDVLTVRARREDVRAFAEDEGLRLLPRAPVTEAQLDRPHGRGRLVEVVVPGNSGLIGRTIAECQLRARYRATVLAARRGTEILHEDLPAFTLSEGNGLLLHATRATIEALAETGDLLVTEMTGPSAAEEARDSRMDPVETALAIGIMIGVIAIAALGWLPIVIAALAGVVAMIVADLLTPRQAYRTVNWEVIFLLAGVIPLGLALQRTGGAEFLAGVLVESASYLPPIAVLAVVYLLTGLLANVITPVASVVLMIPIAVDAAARLGANGFAFVLAVTFAASTAFMTPIGYQTNLMVYSPGGYHFTDYLRVGAPLQLLLSVVTTLGIALLWGVS